MCQAVISSFFAVGFPVQPKITGAMEKARFAAVLMANLWDYTVHQLSRQG